MIESAIRSAIRSVIMNKMLYVMEPALSRLLFYSLFQLNAECEISRSGIEQQAVVKVLGIKDLSELFRRHQVIALQFVVKRQMTVFADLVCDMHGKLSDGIFNHPIYLF